MASNKFSSTEHRLSEIDKTEKLIARMEEELIKTSDKGNFFSRNGRISAIDIVLYSDLTSIVCMYYKQNNLNEKKFPNVHRWMKSMKNIQEVQDMDETYIDIITEQKLMFDIAGGDTY